MEGSQSITGTVQITGFVSDPEHPAAVSAGNTLVVQGSGAVTVDWSITAAVLGTQPTVSLRLNGSIVSSRSGSGGGSWTGQVNDGDQLTMWAAGAQGIAAASAAHIDVMPV